MTPEERKLVAHRLERLEVYKKAIREAVTANLPRIGKDDAGVDLIEIEMAAAVALAHISAFIVASLEQTPGMDGQAINTFLQEFERRLAFGSAAEPLGENEKVHPIS